MVVSRPIYILSITDIQTYNHIRRGRTFFNLVPTILEFWQNLGRFEFILLYELATKLGADQSVCRYMFAPAYEVAK